MQHAGRIWLMEPCHLALSVAHGLTYMLHDPMFITLSMGMIWDLHCK